MTTIRQRILLRLLPLTAAAFVLTAVGLERAVYHDLLAALDAQILNLIQSVGSGVEMEVDGAIEFDLGPAVARQFEGEGNLPYFRVRSERGELLAASGNSPRAVLPAGNGLACSMRASGAGFRFCADLVTVHPERDEEEMEEWREEHSGQPLPDVKPRRFWVEVGLGLDDLNRSLATFRTRLATGFGAFFFVLVAVPFWAVRRALEPLRVLSEQARSIDVTSLDTRLREEGAAAEVQALVTALNQALDRVASAYDRQKRFTADAAHELRTPLSVIRTESEVALRKPRPAQELRDSLAVVQRTAFRLTELMECLLSLARRDAGSSPFLPQPVDLAEIAEETAALLSVAAEAKGLRLLVDTPGPVEAWGDPELLGVCLLKLVENAVRFTPAGGTVRVSARPGPASRLSVEDDGPGIPLAEQERIFERFYRVDPARKRTDRGSGLGLAIARQIAQMHGSRITVTSETGQGSRFDLVLPQTG